MAKSAGPGVKCLAVGVSIVEACLGYGVCSRVFVWTMPSGVRERYIGWPTFVYLGLDISLALSAYFFVVKIFGGRPNKGEN
jgi:hypothetical protein